MNAKAIAYYAALSVLLTLLIFNYTACEGDMEVPDPGGCGGCDGGCGGGGGSVSPSPFTYPGVAGIVTYANGITPIAGAYVTLSPYPGGSISVMSGGTGAFRFVYARDGKYHVLVEKGAFTGKAGVGVSGGKSTELLKIALSVPDGSLGVVPGDHDNVQGLISALGYNASLLSDEDLWNYDSLKPLKFLYLASESNTVWAHNERVQENLRKFVSQGGHLFVSDKDYVYIKLCWPNAITFAGKEPTIGSSQLLTAKVVDKTGKPNLAGYLGKDTAKIRFDRSYWVIINKVGPGTSVLLRGNPHTTKGELSDRPLLVYFKRGSGMVVYTCPVYNAATTDDGVKVWAYIVSLYPDI